MAITPTEFLTRHKAPLMDTTQLSVINTELDLQIMIETLRFWFLNYKIYNRFTHEKLVQNSSACSGSHCDSSVRG